MIRKTILPVLLFCSLALSGQTDFDRYFTDKVLRFDFMFAGDSRKTTVYPAGMKEETYFAGSRTNLIDPFDYGNFKYELFDSEGNKLIYSRGFCTLYQEWQTTSEAKEMERSFYEVATMPFPKNMVRFVISIRDSDGVFRNLYETTIDPADFYIRKEKPAEAAVTRIYGTGDPSGSVDIAFVAEGYTMNEMPLFREDVRRMADALFAEAPFGEYRDRFNIWAVENFIIV